MFQFADDILSETKLNKLDVLCLCCVFSGVFCYTVRVKQSYKLPSTHSFASMQICEEVHMKGTMESHD